MAPNPLIHWPALSNPAANPTRFGKFNPITLIGLFCNLGVNNEVNPTACIRRSPLIDKSWALSASNLNSKDLAIL